VKSFKCKNCRWYTYPNGACVNDASEYCADFRSEDDEACEYYFPLDENELFESFDDDSERIKF